MHINDWAAIQTLFDKLNKQMERTQKARRSSVPCMNLFVGTAGRGRQHVRAGGRMCVLLCAANRAARVSPAVLFCR